MNLIEQYKILTEKKDHIIKRLKNLTDEEKQTLIDFFNKKPNLESKIDWNNKDLSFKDFEDVMSISKTERIKSVKKSGILGLRRGVDYLDFPFSNANGYIPLTHEASRLIAGNDIGKCVGEWCTAMNSSKYWRDYVNKKGIVLIYIIYKDTKYAVAVSTRLRDAGKQYAEIFNASDKSITLDELESETNIDILRMIENNIKIINKAKEIIDSIVPVHESLSEVLDTLEVYIFWDSGLAQINFDDNFKRLDSPTPRDRNSDAFIYTDYGSLPRVYDISIVDMFDIKSSELEKMKQMLVELSGDEYEDFDDYSVDMCLKDIQDSYANDIDEAETLLDNYSIFYEKIYDIFEFDNAVVYVDKKRYYDSTRNNIDRNDLEFLLYGQPLCCKITFNDEEIIYDNVDGQYYGYDYHETVDYFYDKILEDFPNATDGEKEELYDKLKEEIPEEPDYI